MLKSHLSPFTSLSQVVSGNKCFLYPPPLPCEVHTSPHTLVLNLNKSFWLADEVHKIYMIDHDNGVARMLKKLRTSKGDYCIKQRFSAITSLFKMGTSLKGKNLLPEGANSYHLRAVPYGMENHFHHIR